MIRLFRSSQTHLLADRINIRWTVSLLVGTTLRWMQVEASLQRDANQLLATPAKRVVWVWHGSISGLRSSVWSLMMPAAGAASLEALTIRRCQRRGTWTLGTTLHGRGGGAVTSPWWGRTAQRGPCALWRVTPLSISIFHYTQLSDRAQARCSILGYLNFDLLFPASVCEEEKDGGISINNSTDAKSLGRMLGWMTISVFHTIKVDYNLGTDWQSGEKFNPV